MAKKRKIKLSALMEALESADLVTSCYDRETGELHDVNENPGMIDGEDADSKKIADFFKERDLVLLPTKKDIDEYEIMDDFVHALPRGELQDRLADAIEGRGAFRRFKDIVASCGIEKEWYDYRDGAFEKKGREWADSHGIEIVEDQPSKLKYVRTHWNDEPEKKKVLIVIDMQNDFIDGSLGTKQAQAIVPAVVEKIKSYPKENVYATMDTHEEDYLDTQEGKYLPVKHCIRNTDGWKMPKQIRSLILQDHIYEKPTFGSVDLGKKMKNLAEVYDLEIELVGLCTDICVVSNALLIKAFTPETKISIDQKCCAGVTPKKHEAALETMRSCQIQIS